jgi:hypothetical protein
MADVLAKNEWRDKLAEAVPYLPAVYSLICNFPASKLTFDQLKKDQVTIVTEKDSTYHTSIKKTSFPESLITYALVKNFQKTIKETKKKSCYLVYSDTALSESKMPGLHYGGTPVKDIQSLSWWTSKKNADTNAAAKEFWKAYQQTEDWKTDFKEAYGSSYEDYLALVSDI